MTEDRGAFKTNPADLRQISPFVIDRERRCKQVSRPKKSSPGAGAAFAPPIFYKRHRKRCDILKST
jgi:hypothetical protein